MENQIARILSTDLNLQIVEHLESNEQEIDKLEQLLGEKNGQVYELHRLINQELQKTIEENVVLRDGLRDARAELTGLRKGVGVFREEVEKEKARLQRWLTDAGQLLIEKIKGTGNKDILKRKESEKCRAEISTQTEADLATIHLVQRLQKLQQTVLSLKQQKWSLEKEVKKYQTLYLSPSPQKSYNSTKSLTQEQKQCLVMKAISTNFSQLPQRKYCGEMIGNRKHGRGICEYGEDFVYEGQFVNGLRSGLGEMKYQGQLLYKGQWKEGAFMGKGFLYKVGIDGVVKYCGHFKNGQIEGYGTMFYETGEKVRGNFSMGKLLGAALIQNPSTNTLELSDMASQQEYRSVQLVK